MMLLHWRRSLDAAVEHVAERQRRAEGPGRARIVFIVASFCSVVASGGCRA